MIYTPNSPDEVQFSDCIGTENCLAQSVKLYGSLSCTIPVKGLQHYTRVKRMYYTHITRSVHAPYTQFRTVSVCIGHDNQLCLRLTNFLTHSFALSLNHPASLPVRHLRDVANILFHSDGINLNQKFWKFCNGDKWYHVPLKVVLFSLKKRGQLAASLRAILWVAVQLFNIISVADHFAPSCCFELFSRLTATLRVLLSAPLRFN